MLKSFLIVEDHPLYAEALQLCICDGMANVRITHASTLSEAKDAIWQERRFDLVLLDLWLPDTPRLRGTDRVARVISPTPHCDRFGVCRPERCPKIRCLRRRRLHTQVRKTRTRSCRPSADILAGKVTPPGGALQPESIAKTEQAALTPRLKSLTPQQLRVLQMLCQGLLNKQIAYELDVGETTVKAHITEIFRKLSVCSRTQAVAEVSMLNLDAMLALYAGDDGTGLLHCSRSTS